MSTRALLVEDDPSVRESTALLLERSAIDVIATETGEAALREFATRAPFDVVIVDLMLPGISGFDVCRRMRDRSTVPIVMLTARSDVADVVAGLELGADDYIVKPFDGAELLARVRAVIRRMKFDPRVPPLRFGSLVVDPAAFRAEKGARPLDLTAMEFRLLLELVRNPGQVLSREALLERVWGYDYLGDSRLVDMAIKRLRAKLGDEAHDPEYIATVRGVGYRFEPRVR
jgi:two-component system, OmpR family, response regulator MtrA